MSSEYSLLSEVADVIDSLHKTPSYVDAGYPMVRVTDVKYGELQLGSTLKVDEATYTEFSRRYKPARGDIIITRVGTYGVTARVANTEFCLGQNTAAIVPRSINGRYLYAALNSATLRSQIDASAVGSTQKTLSLKCINALQIPRLGETNELQIAEIIGALDDRIALLSETNATLEAIAQALFKSWFVDFAPVHARARGEPVLPEPQAALFPDSFEESPLGLVPKGWQVEFIDTWLDVLETGRRPKGGVSGISEGVPSIGAESIFSIGQFDYSKTKFVSEEFFTKMRSGELQSHDVLLYKDGGKPGVFLPRVSMFGDGFPFDRCGINEHVFRIRVKQPLNQAFLYFWVWSDAVMHELKHRGGKAAIPGINQSDVRELKLAVPNAEVLNVFDELTAPLISKIFSNAKQVQTLATLRDTLLPRLISGQLRLPDVDQMIEDVNA